MNCKVFPYFLLLLIIIFIFTYLMYIYESVEKEKDFVLNGEVTKSFKIIFLIILYKIKEKNVQFYSHQFLSLLIIMSKGIIRFIMNSIKLNWNFTLSEDLLPSFVAIFSAFFSQLFLIIIEKYMKIYNYSPYFMTYTSGIIHLVLSIIMLIIF